MIKYLALCLLIVMAAADGHETCIEQNILYGITAQLNNGVTTPGDANAGGTRTDGWTNMGDIANSGFWKTFYGTGRCIPGTAFEWCTYATLDPWTTRTTDCLYQQERSDWDQHSIFWTDWLGYDGVNTPTDYLAEKPSVQYDLGKTCTLTSLRAMLDNNDEYEIYGRDHTTGQWNLITTFSSLAGYGLMLRDTIEINAANIDSIRVYGKIHDDGYFSIGQLQAFGSCIAPPSISCNNVHYWVEEGQLLDTSLQSPPILNTNFHNDLYTTPPMAQGQPNAQAPSAVGCTGTISFAMTSGPTHHTPSAPGFTPVIGQFEVTGPSGSFKYINNAPGIVWNGYDSFTYRATCTNALQETAHCSATAFINVVYTSAASHNRPAPGFGDDYTSVNNRFVKCEGTCETRGESNTMWYARHTLPRLWDMQADEAGAPIMPQITWDGQTFDTDALELKWTYNYAIITTYGTIGNMAARFPTMEEITWKPGQWFSTQDVQAEAGPTSTGFDQSCLDNQGSQATAQTSRGSDVWTWTDSNSLIGHIGPKNVHDVSWYQKFGGKHDHCDAIVAGCRYAPLLTPRQNQNEDTEGVWRIAIKDCTTRWQAKFTWNAFRTQTLHGGVRKAWQMGAPECHLSCPGDVDSIHGYMITGTMYNEVVQPNSWQDASRGFSWLNKKYELKIILKQDTDFQFELGIDIFTVDVDFFRYFDSNNDHSFGYNMIVYPLTLNDLQQSAPDRRITGYKWNTASWVAPSDTQCASCTGPQKVCVDSPDSAPGPFGDYTGDTFPSGNCPEGVARVFLFKGPANTQCTTDPNMHIQGVAGISAQEGCATNYQNITLRATATGSHSVNPKDGFGFEGTIVLQFLLANGEHPHFQITPKMYVQSLCVRGAFSGTTATCRSSPFWPVPDVSGSGSARGTPGSIDIEHDQLYYSLPTLLCEEVDARTFGPTDWAIILFDIKDVDPSLVELRSLYVVFGDQTKNIYFAHDGLSQAPSGPANEFWLPNYGYLHYRNLKQLGQLEAQDSAPTHPDGMDPPKKMDFGFAFTPGAYNENVKITIYCTLRIITGTTTRRFRRAESTEGENTVTQTIQVNKNFGAATRNGLALASQSSVSASASAPSNGSTTGSSSVVIGVLAALCGVMAFAIGGLILFIVRSGSVGTKPARVSSDVQHA